MSHVISFNFGNISFEQILTFLTMDKPHKYFEIKEINSNSKFFFNFFYAVHNVK